MVDQAKNQAVGRRGVCLWAILLIGLAVLLSTPAFAEKEPGVDASSSLAALFEEYYQFELQEDPFSPDRDGVYARNDQLPRVAPADHERRHFARASFLTRLNAIDLADVSQEEAVSAEILAFILKSDAAIAPFKSWRRPFLADSGFHSGIVRQIQSAPFKTKQDVEDYLKRLEALPAYLDQHVQNMRAGLDDKFTQPKEILPFVLPSFEAQVTETAEAHPLFKPFKTMPATLSTRQANRFKRRARRVLSDAVIPAYADVLSFMKDEYVPAAAKTVGAANLPDGEAYYAALVRYYTTLDDATAEDIHALGLKEVARIRNEMDKIIADVGFDGTFKEFQTFLRTDDQFYAPSADALLREAAWISKSIDGKLPKFFNRLPRQPYSVAPVPAEIAPNYTTGRYVGAALTADRGGQYWVNTYDLRTRPLYELKALSLHEAVPGHHLQIALSLEVENVPEFRKGFYPHAYGEGWGLYAEALGVEMGIYETPYDHFGRLSYEMWRACRLVIDTGLHSKGWTRQQALDYLADNTALSLHNVQTEVDRYIAWPGQALAYKMGELKIWELRRKAENTLGDKFDIRAFHDAVLTQGGVPLDLLEKRINAYIESAKAVD